MSFQLNGEESFDTNEVVDSNAKLKYRWRCTQKLQPATFCKTDPISQSSKFTIPADAVLQDDEFHIYLTVTSPYGTTADTEKVITVSKDASDLELGCKKNCPPVIDVSNHKLVTFVEVTCHKNCDDIREEFYKWTIEPKPKSAQFSFDYNKHSRNGRTGSKFIIEKNVLKPGTYTISVELKSDVGHHGLASIDLG
ncbi:unnamed protein product [Tenebrio molitor]|nr:unnamed protein product [Tenebrio molitor]